jgi:epoxyqueuosine reductase
MSPPAPVPFSTVRALGAEAGLDALAVIAPPKRLAAEPLDRMLADGVGDMGWLARTRDARLDPVFLLPSARSILVAALPYQPEAGCGELKRSRYAAGKDYHRLLRGRLAQLGKALAKNAGKSWRSRAAVDSAPLNERTLAHLAGLGWIGRNGLLISPRSGSYRLLGFLLTEAPLAPAPAGLGADRCGRCHACERRCPTGALTKRRILSERCISYLTIEHRGVIPRALSERFAGQWFGCDVCQEACPWNRFAQDAGDSRLKGADDDAELLTVTAATFDPYFAGRAVRRLGYERFRRNLLVALASLGRTADCRSLIAEGRPLVLAQASELGLKGD